MDKIPLTPGERLLIRRRRLGCNQQDMARLYGVSRTKYGRAERDLEIATFPVPKSEDVIPNAQEKYLILRRRAGLRHRDIANELNLSRFWVNQMELGLAPDDQLRKFWENYA